ncbi:hypothetical protein [Cereibacter sphaeroides]|jgi:hypothetical protein|uniref:hypothetical protein n=1 Tax=Cereibacter sphaeroides TaxID=1063 RepID=UPI0000663F80|nr:hypothetical protein Rsph17029_0624 [Cereibacter sphaeroides ATCC 17029]
MGTIITLRTAEVVRQDIRFHDGEWLSVQIRRRPDLVGDLLMTIDEEAAGRAAGPLCQFSAVGDQFDEPPAAVEALVEGKVYHFNVWRSVQGRHRLAAQGLISKEQAIEPASGETDPEPAAVLLYDNDGVTLLVDADGNPYEVS